MHFYLSLSTYIVVIIQVTLINNLDKFGIDVKAMAKELRSLKACNTSIQESTSGLQVLSQGNHATFIHKLLKGTLYVTVVNTQSYFCHEIVLKGGCNSTKVCTILLLLVLEFLLTIARVLLLYIVIFVNMTIFVLF